MNIDRQLILRVAESRVKSKTIYRIIESRIADSLLDIE